MSEARFHHPLPFGAEWRGDGTTRFRLWAPAAGSVSISFPDGTYVAMEAEEGGWFSAIARAGPGTRYRYRLASGLEIPDPASRGQDGDVGGWSVVGDPGGYAWRHGGWRGRPWHEAVLYELHVGAFGGFRGVMAELPRLARLGITAIELMPIADFAGSRNWGYDGVLPFAPEEAYGTADDLKALVDEAHGHGLMMFLDVVYNHFGPEGNWLHTYAPGFFAGGVRTPWGDAIDFSRREVRDFFIENALYWVTEYRFDGLRFDAVQAIERAPGNGMLEEMARRLRAAVEPGRHLHLVVEDDANTASRLGRSYDAQWNDDGHHCLHVLLTGEHEGYYGDYAEAPAALLARCLAEGFAYQGEPSPYRGGAPRGEPSSSLPPTAFVLFLQNHDQIGNRAFGDRLTALAPPAVLDAARALLLLAPQIPLIFMGEEWASRQPFLYFTDYSGALADAVRAGRSREFSRFTAFASEAARASLPAPSAPDTFARSRLTPEEALAPEGARALAMTGALLALRHAEIVPRLAGARSLGAEAIGAAAVSAAWRMGDGSILRALSNLGAEPVTVAKATAPPLHVTPPAAAPALAQGRLAGFTTAWLLDRAGARRR